MLTYDRSLSAFCSVLVELGLGKIIDDSWFGRNLDGQLFLLVPDDIESSVDLVALRKSVMASVGKYAVESPDCVQRRSSHHLGESAHLALPESVHLSDGSSCLARVIDQRASGQDWLQLPASAGSEQPAPPRLVFWSMKGGVGRTTALTVLAAQLAGEGQNVLIVDLDLEAPGVGSQLLSDDDQPEFGVLDYLTELRVGSVDANAVLGAMVGVSSLTRGSGLVHVCPAVGRATRDNPAGFMGKLFRAYGRQNLDGVETSFAQRIDRMISGIVGLQRYDAVLVDARAGISESTAAAVLNLGGDVLLFGHDTPQTFLGYVNAFAHLNRFALDNSDWVMRLKMVHAKASFRPEKQAIFRDQAFEIFSEWLYGEGDAGFSLDDIEAPHYAWRILDDSNFTDFDPVANPDLLGVSATQATFGDFVKACKERLGVTS